MKEKNESRDEYGKRISDHYESSFIDAINKKKKIEISYFSNKHTQVIDHVCAPVDFGNRTVGKPSLFIFWDFDDNELILLLPEKIADMEFISDFFDPNELHGLPSSYILQRDW